MSIHDDYNGTLLSDVDEEETPWLWRNWVPLKCVGWVIGPSGLGKSTILADLAARVTRDAPMPDGTLCEAPGGVIVISLEEGLKDTVTSRYRVAGADLSKVTSLGTVKREWKQPGDLLESPFELPTDLALLKRVIVKRHVTLVVFDPFMAGIAASTRIYGNQTASKVFMDLQAIAEYCGVAVLIVNHYTKKSIKDGDLMSAMQGPATLYQRARYAIALAPDESDPGRIVMMLYKHSLGPKMPHIWLRHDGKHVEYLTGLTEEAQALQVEKEMHTSRVIVLEVLRDDPTLSYTPTELSQICEVSYDTMCSTLRKMCTDGQIEKQARGFYKLSPPPATSFKGKRPGKRP